MTSWLVHITSDLLGERYPSTVFVLYGVKSSQTSLRYGFTEEIRLCMKIISFSFFINFLDCIDWVVFWGGVGERDTPSGEALNNRSAVGTEGQVKAAREDKELKPRGKMQE